MDCRVKPGNDNLQERRVGVPTQRRPPDPRMELSARADYPVG
jgi:hypothetical protein